MSGALSVHLGLPEAQIFRFPPEPHPPLIRPASRTGFSWDRPVDIPSTVYSFSLDARLPIFTACVYIAVVCVFNHLNKRRQYRPWPITRTASFTYFAFAHNLLLSLFSAWVFLGVCRTIISSVPSQPSAPYHIVETFCRFDLSEYSTSRNTLLPLTIHDDGFSGASQAKSLWESGMDYYTWMFYISKYYEIMDTLLLLVKGKKVSFLQMYHHAGAIICTWVGFLYRTPQGVVGVSLNTGIHTLMYLYYSLTTLKIKVPVFMKRTLTRLQIAQFVLGGLASWLYVFISYDSPMDTSLVPTEDKSDNQTYIKRGGESNVIFCMNNSGQVFALMLTTVYLIPLTQLFLRFFGQTYKLETKKKAL
ncbi:ELO family [Aspergillus pseudotamarii]|uniref:Elongation of fatty acids protein n=1 Tax=Aspergillus pseudotamarii TaxID=132259 RepID=A0A5N6T3U7_ASPPS|nr:ELO family [Aspergillus pseudotamarii]KAE8140881.1 ELO family [Aspergillus pseudotamarii]